MTEKKPDKLADKLDEILKTGGIAAVSAYADQSIQAAANENIFRMGDMPEARRNDIYKLGLATLDDHYRLRKGDFCVITGRPGSGKSTFINEVACRMAKTHHWTTIFASFEQTPQVDHRRALRTWAMEKRESLQSDAERAFADRWINRYFAFVVPNMDQDITVDWTLGCMRDAVIKYNADMIVVDPWNEMDHFRPNGMTLTEYTGFAIKAFRRFAIDHNVHVIVAAHPAKMYRNKNGEYDSPSLYDISDSAHWANKCDIGIVLERAGVDANIHVLKSRYHDLIGEPGKVKAAFNRETGRYMIIEPDMQP